MSKEYIRECYKLAMSDYKIASSDEDRNKALDELARLIKVSTNLYGFDFADELQSEYDKN